jgi:putative membrane protein
MYPNPPFRGGDQGGLVYHHGGPGPFGWTVLALQLLLVLGVAWLLVSLLLGRFSRHPAAAAAAPTATRESQPLETLHMRYARGEIGRDEYLQARSDLGGEPYPPSEQPTRP